MKKPTASVAECIEERSTLQSSVLDANGVGIPLRPMVECQEYQHDMVIEYTIGEKEKRLWMDLDHDVLFGSGLCERGRQVRTRWSATMEGHTGLNAS